MTASWRTSLAPVGPIICTPIWIVEGATATTLASFRRKGRIFHFNCSVDNSTLTNFLCQCLRVVHYCRGHQLVTKDSSKWLTVVRAIDIRFVTCFQSFFVPVSQCWTPSSFCKSCLTYSIQPDPRVYRKMATGPTLWYLLGISHNHLLWQLLKWHKPLCSPP